MVRLAVRSLFRDPFACVGLAILLCFVVAGAVAPWLSPHESRQALVPLLRPSAKHPLGTDDMGYDLLSELLWGARYSLTLAMGAAMGSTLLGTLVGLVAGYRQRVGFALLRAADVFLAVPRFPLIVLLAAYARPGFATLLTFFCLFGWPSVTRIVYAHVLKEQHQGYNEAARAIGATARQVVLRHLLPSCVPIAFARFVAEMQHVVVAEASLSFLGLGDPTARSWGLTLYHASRYPALLITDAWQWWAVPPGMAITLVCLATALIGVGLEAAGNPQIAAWEADGVRRLSTRRNGRRFRIGRVAMSNQMIMSPERDGSIK